MKRVLNNASLPHTLLTNWLSSQIAWSPQIVRQLFLSEVAHYIFTQPSYIPFIDLKFAFNLLLLHSSFHL